MTESGISRRASGGGGGEGGVINVVGDNMLMSEFKINSHLTIFILCLLT